ncbi:hypothetical protein MHY1_02398 [Methylovirgula sp. HY1]|nr:hypothetical protein MHY1_02398 [Methylovirgula sp. HY1]
MEARMLRLSIPPMAFAGKKELLLREVEQATRLRRPVCARRYGPLHGKEVNQNGLREPRTGDPKLSRLITERLPIPDVGQFVTHTFV